MKNVFEGFSPPKNIHERIKRYEYLKHLFEVYSCSEDDDDKPHGVPIWETWLHESGELPPDFDSFPAISSLPNLLIFDDGVKITNAEQWKKRRKEILDILRFYTLGDWPPPPPAVTAFEIDMTKDEELNCIRKFILLSFASSAEAVEKNVMVQEGKRKSLIFSKQQFKTALLKVELLIPQGEGPFPAVVGILLGTQPFPALMGRDGQVVWLPRVGMSMYDHAAKRGYVVCKFDCDDAFAIKDVFTGSSCNQLVWWAWAASRCIDYLYTLDIVDKNKIAVMGHSRGGNTSLLCAALDDRVCAAIPSHTGPSSGGTAPWRYICDKYGAETLEDSTRMMPNWTRPRMRFFAGRENKLPFDNHFNIALVAPKPLLITVGDRDEVNEPWGAQQAYMAAKEVYKLFGAEDKLYFHVNNSTHTLNDVTLEMYIDWLDMQFGKKPLDFPEKLMHTYTYDKWREITRETVDLKEFPEKGLEDLLIYKDSIIKTPEEWEIKKKDIKKCIMWMLGEPIPFKKLLSVSLVDKRTEGNLVKAKIFIDERLVCHLTYPVGKIQKLPVVIYCHGYLDALGFDWSRTYGWATSVGERLAQRGFLAVEFNLFGYGTRNHDSDIEFYVKHPRQSALGVMFQDVKRIIDALIDVNIVDQEKIMLVGYSLGGTVALYAAALDERVKAVASICGFASMRMDAHEDETEGLKRYSHLRPTLPRLGFFVGHEKKVPYDYHEILAMIAPRHLLILAPRLDQDWFPEDVEKCYEESLNIYKLLGFPQNIQLYMPDDFNRYPPKYQNTVNEWLSKIAGL